MNKIYYILALLLLHCSITSAQAEKIHIWNRMCTVRDTAILFNNTYNQLLVYCKGTKPDDLVLKSPDSSLNCFNSFMVGDTQVYDVTPSFAKNKRPQLVITDKKNKKVKQQIYFSVRPEVLFQARLGDINGNFAFRHDIINQNIIHIVPSDSLYYFPIQVTDFTFSTYQGDDTISINGYGYNVTDEMKKIIRYLPIGTTIKFSHIFTRLPDSKARSWNEINIVVR